MSTKDDAPMDISSLKAGPVATDAATIDATAADAAQSRFEAEIAALIVSALHLEVAAAEIEPDAPLFIDGLGLDSIDALELALALSRDYGVELKSDDGRNRAVFANLRSLAAHVETYRTK